MKKVLVLIIAMGLCFQVIGANKKIACTYEMGGYDDEFINAVVDKTTVKKLEYIPFYGDGGKFRKVSDRLFQKYDPEVVFTTIISFSDDFKNATLITVYINGAYASSSKHFVCQDK